MTHARSSFTLLAIALNAALCGCASHSTTVNRPVGDLSPGSFEVAWAADTSVKSPQALYLVSDTLFVFDKGNVVSAFDLNGGLKFRIPVGEPGDIIGVPMVQPNRIIFPTSGALQIYTADGIKLREITLSQPVRSPGVVVGDFVYVGSDSDTGGRVSAIDLTRQYNIYKWSVLTGIVNSKPALFENVLYCGTEDGRVYAINLDRTPLWAQAPEMPDGLFHTDGKIITALKADESGVYVPSTDTKLYCLAPNTGHLRWEYYAGVPLTASPTLTAESVYQYVNGQGLVCLAKKSTERIVLAKWTYADGKQLLADDSKYAYVLTNDGGIAALNKADGTPAFRTTRSDIDKAVTSLDLKNPAAYALTKDGRLVCIRPVLKSGTVGELAMLGDR